MGCGSLQTRRRRAGRNGPTEALNQDAEGVSGADGPAAAPSNKETAPGRRKLQHKGGYEPARRRSAPRTRSGLVVYQNGGSDRRRNAP